MKIFAYLFISLQAVDAFLTLWATNHGFQEVNPVMMSIADSWWIVVVKLVPAIMVTAFLARLAYRHQLVRRVTVAGLGAACTFLAVVLVSNIMEII